MPEFLIFLLASGSLALLGGSLVFASTVLRNNLDGDVGAGSLPMCKGIASLLIVGGVVAFLGVGVAVGYMFLTAPRVDEAFLLFVGAIAGLSLLVAGSGLDMFLAASRLSHSAARDVGSGVRSRSRAIALLGWLLAVVSSFWLLPIIVFGALAIAFNVNLAAQRRKSRETDLLWLLAVCVKGKFPLATELRVLAKTLRGRGRQQLEELAARVDAGESLADALRSIPRILSEPDLMAIQVATETDTLPQTLEQLAREATERFRPDTEFADLSALFVYMAMVLGGMGFILSGIMIWIIPKFKEIFEGFDTELPGITVMLIDMSDWMANYWYLIPAIPIGSWVMLKIIRKNRTGKYITDAIFLRIPLLGQILRKSVVARTMRTLGTLVASGVPILEAIIIARDTSGNEVFVRAFDNIYTAIREGESIAVPLKEARIVDDLVVNMIDVGEETGALDNMMYKIADVYDEEVSVLVEGLVNLLEPIMVVVLGLIVGFIVIALFMPLVKLLNDLA